MCRGAAEQRTATHIWPRQIEQNTYTAPGRIEHRPTYRAAPDRTEHCCVCRTGRNGRLPRMPPRAERKNAAHAAPSRMEECHMCCARQNGGPPHTLGRARHNGTPMPRRAERNTAAHTGLRQTEQNTAAHTGPCQTQWKTSTYAAPGGTEDRRAYRPGWKGRTPRMPRRAERKTAAHTKGRNGQDGRPLCMREVCRAYGRPCRSARNRTTTMPRRAGRKTTMAMPRWA